MHPTGTHIPIDGFHEASTLKKINEIFYWEIVFYEFWICFQSDAEKLLILFKEEHKAAFTNYLSTKRPNIVYPINKSPRSCWRMGSGSKCCFSDFSSFARRQADASTHCESISLITKDTILMWQRLEVGSRWTHASSSSSSSSNAKCSSVL